MSRPLILASRSPQRRAILTQLGVDFEVVDPGVDELDRGDPREVVLENALRKARSVSAEGRVLGVDTDVVLDGRVFGKPSDEGSAREALLALSARVHEVWSGIALIEGGSERTSVAVTRVRFRALDDPVLDWYLASGEWRDRAGGYAIQGRGAALVESIDGDFWNVVGLPVPNLLELAPDLAR
ncbi:MAG: Maf family protein [Actinomycetota bacterium]|nr:Maf family protein [Actinomycetota bacterium]